MRIGIIGGTGGMGEGFALRWCFTHDVIIGSRDAQRAKQAADNYIKIALEAYGKSITGSITGDDNFELARNCDLLLLSVPYENIESTCNNLQQTIRNDCVVVSPIVPMTKTQAGFVYIPFEQRLRAAACMVADALPPRCRVISAFHTISEVKLRNVKQSLDADTFVCGDDVNTVSRVNSLISEINGLRAIYLGPLSMTYQAEILTPMLLNAAKMNKMKNPGIRLV
ncbi:MAG: NADPH-dependent F420 reductase [Nitrososphaeraceae archaeon]